MDFFTALNILIAIALLWTALRGQKPTHLINYRKAVTFFIMGVIIYYPVAEMFSFVLPMHIAARVVGFIFSVLAFRYLCLAWGAPIVTVENQNLPPSNPPTPQYTEPKDYRL